MALPSVTGSSAVDHHNNEAGPNGAQVPRSTSNSTQNGQGEIVMITRTNHWKLINQWVAVGAICGLLWGTAVALLMTLSLATVAEGAAWVPLLMERTRIGACAGCFFGTVAGLILVVERLSISPATVSGRWGLFLLFVVVAWFYKNKCLCCRFVSRCRSGCCSAA